MLKDVVISKLNEQMKYELEASQIYLQASAWCNARNYEGCAKFLRTHSDEEKSHMYRLYDYIIETGGEPILSAIEAPRNNYDSLVEVFQEMLENERKISHKINELVDICLQEKDHSTFNFLQWYVAEQHQEENLFQGILSKFQLIGNDKKNLFFIDREVGALPN